jgi:hypothetical protein
VGQAQDDNCRVKLLVDTCHGLAGEIVAVSTSRAALLIEQKRAEFFMAGGWPLKDKSPSGGR